MSRNLETRVEKLETAIGGVANLHWIGSIIANGDETAIECVTRIAAARGIALSDVGDAVVFWRDDHRLRRHETYRHPSVRNHDDVTRLIGYVSQDERVKARERREKESGEKFL